MLSQIFPQLFFLLSVQTKNRGVQAFLLHGTCHLSLHPVLGKVVFAANSKRNTPKSNLNLYHAQKYSYVKNATQNILFSKRYLPHEMTKLLSIRHPSTSSSRNAHLEPQSSGHLLSHTSLVNNCPYILPISHSFET